jgi:tight adherence protein B
VRATAGMAATVGAAALVSLHHRWSSRRVRTRVADLARSLQADHVPGLAARSAPVPALPVLSMAVVAGAAGAALVVLALGPAVAVLVVLAGVAAPPVVRRHRRAAARARRRTQLPHALEALAAALRSGSSLPMALEEAGRATPTPLGAELAELAAGAAQGQPIAVVLDGWTRRHGDPGTRLAATALALATGVGAAPARAIDGVATTLRERLELAAERRALASQARTSALVLSAAPLVFAVLLGMSDDAAGRFLLHSRAGWACLALGLGLDAVGAWWMSRLTRGGEP